MLALNTSSPFAYNMGKSNVTPQTKPITIVGLVGPKQDMNSKEINWETLKLIRGATKKTPNRVEGWKIKIDRMPANTEYPALLKKIIPELQPSSDFGREFQRITKSHIEKETRKDKTTVYWVRVPGLEVINEREVLTMYDENNKLSYYDPQTGEKLFLNYYEPKTNKSGTAFTIDLQKQSMKTTDTDEIFRRNLDTPLTTQNAINIFELSTNSSPEQLAKLQGSALFEYFCIVNQGTPPVDDPKDVLIPGKESIHGREVFTLYDDGNPTTTKLYGNSKEKMRYFDAQTGRELYTWLPEGVNIRQIGDVRDCILKMHENDEKPNLTNEQKAEIINFYVNNNDPKFNFNSIKLNEKKIICDYINQLGPKHPQYIEWLEKFMVPFANEKTELLKKHEEFTQLTTELRNLTSYMTEKANKIKTQAVGNAVFRGLSFGRINRKTSNLNAEIEKRDNLISQIIELAEELFEEEDVAASLTDQFRLAGNHEAMQTLAQNIANQYTNNLNERIQNVNKNYPCNPEEVIEKGNRIQKLRNDFHNIQKKTLGTINQFEYWGVYSGTPTLTEFTPEQILRIVLGCTFVENSDLHRDFIEANKNWEKNGLILPTVELIGDKRYYSLYTNVNFNNRKILKNNQIRFYSIDDGACQPDLQPKIKNR